MTQLLPGYRRLRLLDWAVAVWVAVWIGLGVAIGLSVGNLTTLSRTVIADGHSVEQIGGSLHTLSAVPLVGSAIAGDGSQLQQAGAQAVSGAQSSVSSIDLLSVLLAVAVALLPSVPVLGFYLPLRIERRRECRAMRAALADHGDDPEFQAFLARRAFDHLSYRRLREAAPAAWSGQDGREEAVLARAKLARAELEWLGIDSRPLRGPSGSGR